jgi:hypothetical protein
MYLTSGNSKIIHNNQCIKYKKQKKVIWKRVFHYVRVMGKIYYLFSPLLSHKLLVSGWKLVLIAIIDAS